MQNNDCDEIKKEYEEVKVFPKEERIDSYFDGKFIEYIGYKLLAFIITIFTLTIASAWAEKLLISYKINHTIYNGKRLKFEGTGASLFVEKFKWFLFSIITIGIYTLWIPIKKEKWIVSNIHFEDEEYIKEDSFFEGKLLCLIGVNLITNLLSVFSLGLLLPFAICYKYKWIAKHTIINRKRLVFDGKAIGLLGHYLLWYLLSIITIGIYAWWMPMKMYGWYINKSHIMVKDEKQSKSSIIPLIIGILLTLSAIGLILFGIKESGFSFKGLINWVSGSGSISEIFDNTSSTIGTTDINSAESLPHINDNYKNNKVDGNDFSDQKQSVNPKANNKETNNSDSVSSKSEKRCNSGYIYYENMCFNPNDYLEPTHGCVDGFLHSFSSCYPITDTSFCENSSDEYAYIYIEGQCVNNQMAIQESSNCPNGYKITTPSYSLGFESMICYKYTKPNN